MDAIFLLAVLVAAYLGFALLALSQGRHWQAVARASALSPRAVRTSRAMGVLLIALSLILALERDGAGFGSLLWVTAMGVSAQAVAFTLASRPRWLRVIAVPVLYFCSPKRRFWGMGTFER